MKPVLRLLPALLLALAACRAAAPAPASAPPLRVLTYNLHHGEGTDGVLDLERIARVIEDADVDLVALAPSPCPSYELARQGGAQVRWDGGGFSVVRDENGRCRSTGPWTAWVCGDAAGYPEAAHEDDAAPRRPGDISGFGRAHDAAARADGQRIGQAVLTALREEAR